MSPDKGCHRAIAIAMRGRAPAEDRRARCASRRSRSTSSEFVEPHLGDDIEYLGEVTHGEKVELLQNARATLFPIEWEEPFGLVMIESMACGTPVIATRCGAVPEVIEHGRGGIIVDDYREMAAALEEADALRPAGLPALRRGALLRPSGWSRTTSLRTRARSSAPRVSSATRLRPACPSSA